MTSQKTAAKETKVVYHLLGKTGRSIVVVKSIRVKSQIEIFSGMPSFHFQDFFSEDRFKGDVIQKTRN